MTPEEIVFKREPLLVPINSNMEQTHTYAHTYVQTEKKDYSKLEIDSPIETYDVMKKYIQHLKGIEGLSCEIGLRRGGGTKVIVDTFIDNNDKRVHICIDPYGNIIYTDIVGPHRSDYTNSMKNETLAELYSYARDKNVDIIFFNLEDSEFYRRYCDGVPVYNEDKSYVNNYCFVHVDGQHENEAVKLAANFFIPRMSINGIIIFDNTDHYDHGPTHSLLLNNKFVFLEDVLNKKVYKRVL